MITKAKIKNLERLYRKLNHREELPPPLFWDSCKKMHPELTDEQIDGLYIKAGIKPLKINLIRYDDKQNED